MKITKFIILVLFYLFPLVSSSVNVDWSGWSRVENYYQKNETQNYYFTYHFVLKPEIHIVDSLQLKAYFDFTNFVANKFMQSGIKRQAGVAVLYKEPSKTWESIIPLVFLNMTQLYVDYQSEFFKVRYGRAPYHAGLGTTYSSSTDPLQNWQTVHHQLKLYFEYSQFDFQPVVFYQGHEGLLVLAQLGLSREDWRISAFYQNDFKSHSLIEAFGKYTESNWEAKASASYIIQQAEGFLLALESSIQVPTKIPFQLEIKMGAAFGEAVFHPNYNPALILWNRYMFAQDVTVDDSKKSYFQIEEGRMKDGMYISPQLLFSFAENKFQLKPALIFARDLAKKTFSYELDLESKYQLGNSWFVVLKGGALYDEKLHLALLTQVAVSF